MVGLKVYVEGGGSSSELHTECRKAFARFIEKANVKFMPTIVACGTRRKAFDAYRNAIKKGESAILLVDSEETITQSSKWKHLEQRKGDHWITPPHATEEDCHLMVECMEAWLIADRKALGMFFGQGFRETSLPSAGRALESVSKKELEETLKKATQNCKTKGRYSKGKHSFKLLGLIDTNKVIAASPYAKAFIDELKTRLG